jgi:hypothetical protein
MAEPERWNVQVSIKVGDSMLNVRGDSFPEVVAHLREGLGEAFAQRALEVFGGALSSVDERAALDNVKQVLGATEASAPAAVPQRTVKDPDAPPTEKQLELAGRLGIVSRGLTPEEAVKAGWTRGKLSAKLDERLNK